MAVIAAPARPVTELRDRLVRRAEVVGVWAVDCVCATARTPTGRRSCWVTPSTGTSTRRSRPRATTRQLRGGARRAPARDGLRAARVLGQRASRTAAPGAGAAHAARDPRGAHARPGPRAGHGRAANRRRRRSRSVGTRSPRRAARSRRSSQAVVALQPHDLAVGGLGRHPERVALALDDQDRHRDGLEFRQPRLLRLAGGCSGNARQSDAGRAGLPRRPARHPRA